MTDNQLKVIGVPEHFNLPWRLLEESQLLDATGVRLRFEDVAEGTGAMIERLRSGDADIALLLTEGAVAGIGQQGGYRIVGEYVASPLRWGIHVAAGGALQNESALEGHRFAISRYGSGSHLMAALYAEQKGWAKPPEFRVVNTLAGAVEALTVGDADLFLWEQFTTQPLVDDGTFRRVGVLPTPWPCFVACLSEKSPHSPAVARAALQAALSVASLLKAQPTTSQPLFADRYRLQLEAVGEWLSLTQWSINGELAPHWVGQISSALNRVGSIDQPVRPADAMTPANLPG